ncbi:MAG: hypothetical protein L6R39_001577 [Caloplaca ligustica]|nr:MAG: hypothetical protein L6R39_001577 [Caloplaca ligustica]
MEVFVRNLHDQSTEKQVKQYFRPILADLNIYVFHCKKPRSKGFAIITIRDPLAGQKFLDLHGQSAPGHEGFRNVKKKLYRQNKPVNCHRSHSAPDEFILRSLEREESERSIADRRRRADPVRAKAPRFFEKDASAELDLARALGRLGLLQARSNRDAPKRRRATAIDAQHQAIVASCLCYSFRVDPGDIQALQALKRLPGLPEIVSWHIAFVDKNDFANQMTKLNAALSAENYTCFAFEVKFQLQRLALNAYLPPSKVLRLMQAMERTFANADTLMLAAALRRFSNQIPFAGPGTEASDLSWSSLLELLVDNYHHLIREKDYSKDIAQVYDHMASIHKVMVTPAGVYLSGPEPEVKNRVLRQYSAFSSHFLQVTFSDEDGEPVRFDRTSSLDVIYHERFTKVLSGNISIAGRPYEFLGFSHSSLRSQTCWFMAPFTWNGELRYARAVIRDLGDFRAIRSPAKCAARIGQAFSQAFSSVNLPKEAFCLLPEVERSDTLGIRRVFSDGVGTCSKAVLEKIWAAYAQSRTWKPTVCQIRYAGQFPDSLMLQIEP